MLITGVLRIAPGARRVSSSSSLRETTSYMKPTLPRTTLRSCKIHFIDSTIHAHAFHSVIVLRFMINVSLPTLFSFMYHECDCGRYACEPRSSLIMLPIPLESIPNAPEGLENRLFQFTLSVTSSSFREMKVRCSFKMLASFITSHGVFRELSAH